jgi:hypothetical protein
MMACCYPANSQVELDYLLDLGQTNVSQGLYISTALVSAYSFDKYALKAGAQFQLIHPSSRVFSAAEFVAGRRFCVGKQTLEAEAFYLYRNFSSLMFISNWGLAVSTRLRHWQFDLGQDFKSYRVREKALSYETEGNVLRENFNLIYHIAYFINSPEKTWNISLSLTNRDHFLINQETNPMLSLRAESFVSSTMKLYLENWYKPAGALNMSAHYFSYFLRTGLIWTPVFGN